MEEWRQVDQAEDLDTSVHEAGDGGVGLRMNQQTRGLISRSRRAWSYWEELLHSRGSWIFW